MATFEKLAPIYSCPHLKDWIVSQRHTVTCRIISQRHTVTSKMRALSHILCHCFTPPPPTLHTELGQFLLHTQTVLSIQWNATQ